MSLSLTLAADAADGKFYRWTDKSGAVHYTDTPPPDDAVQPTVPTGDEKRPQRDAVPPGDARTERLRMAMIDELLTLAGVKREIVEQVPAGLKIGFETGSGPAGKTEQGAALLGVLLDAFRADTFYPALRKSFRSYLDDEQLGATLTFYRSPLGKMFARLAVDAAPKSPEEMRAFAARVGSDAVARARRPLIERLDLATGMTELGLDTSAAMFTTGALAVAQALPPERRPSRSQIERLASEIRTQGRDRMQQGMVLRYLYVYRGVPDAELAEYVEFAETDAGRWFSGALRGSLLDTITAIGDKLQPEIARSLGPRAGDPRATPR